MPPTATTTTAMAERLPATVPPKLVVVLLVTVPTGLGGRADAHEPAASFAALKIINGRSSGLCRQSAGPCRQSAQAALCRCHALSPGWWAERGGGHPAGTGGPGR